jgi:hypothetical protein
LARRGYKCAVAFRRSYRGSIHLSQIVTVDLGDSLGFALMLPPERVAHFRKTAAVQDQLPMAAKILEIVENRVAIVERVGGTLLWELEDNLPPVSEINHALGLFVSCLMRVNLIHADIRPWNVFYDSTRKEFRVIDWGFSFFNGDQVDPKTRGHLQGRGYRDTPHQAVDGMDATKTVQVLRGEVSYESAWHHGPNEMEWRPKWAKREPPARG